jgi:hypothetical protein
MITPIPELNSMVIDALKASGLTLYDYVKAGQKMPYVVLASTTFKPDKGSKVITVGTAYMTVLIYSDYAGDKQVNELTEEVLEIISEAKLDMENWKIIIKDYDALTVQRLTGGVREANISLNFTVGRK